MGDVLAFLKLISPVLVGAVIGYFTNFIAIKMLFRPHKEYRIGKFRIPFTPGIIPKNRGRLAKAIGTAVGETLFTTNDLVDTVKNSPLKTQISDKIINIVFETDTTVESLTGTKDIAKSKPVEEICDMAGEKLVIGLCRTDMKPMISSAVDEKMGDKLRNPMVSMFLNEKMLNSIYEKIEDAIKDYLRNNGSIMFSLYLNEELDHIAKKPFCDAAEELKLNRENIHHAVDKAVDMVADKIGDTVSQSIDIKTIVSDKIDAMDINELEALVMSVMKNELQAIINLGAVIGAVIGIINIFI